MTDHEHDWQYVEKQAIWEGYSIDNLDFEGDDDTQVLYVVVDSGNDPAWQDVEGTLENKVSCTICNVEYPYPNGGWQIEWK